MKRPLQVGDRVAVYERGVRLIGTISELSERTAEILFDDHKRLLFSPQQCRRLVKKPLRRIWVDGSYNHPDYKDILGKERVKVVASHVPISSWIEFVEARRKL